jgi:hypothetical protein
MKSIVDDLSGMTKRHMLDFNQDCHDNRYEASGAWAIDLASAV